MNSNRDITYKYLQGKFGMVSTSVLDEILASDYKEHQPSVTRGINEVKEFAVKLTKAFTNQIFTVQDEILKNDKVVFRYSWHAIHTYQFMDWQATNKEVSTQGIIIARVKNGKIAEIWEEWDFAGFRRQLEVS